MILFIADPHAYGPGRTHIATWNQDRKQMIAWCQKLRPGDVIWPGHTENPMTELRRVFDPKRAPDKVDCQRCASWWRKGKRPIDRPYEKEAHVATEPALHSTAPVIALHALQPQVQPLLMPGLPEGVTFELVLATPDLAEYWLREKNVDNRPVSEGNVLKLERTLNEGRFIFDAHPIRFDWNDIMIDGQHRCIACVRTGVPFLTVVVRGLDPAVKAMLDQHKPRDGKDVLAMLGYVDASHLAPVAKICYWWDHDLMHARSQDKALTNDVVADYVRHNHDVLQRANTLARTVASHTKIPYTALACAYYILSKVNLADAYLFFDQVKKGYGLQEGSPILLLRQKGLSVHASKTRVPIEAWVSMIIRTWNDTRKGVKKQKLYVYGQDNAVLRIPVALP